MTDTFKYFVVKDANRSRRLERLRDRSGSFATAESAPMATRSGSLRTATELSGIEPELSFRTEAISAHDLNGFGREQAADPNTEAHGILLPVSPLFAEPDTASVDPIDREIMEDDARAAGEPENWGIDELGAHHSNEFDGSSARVAIIDSGLSENHVAFTGKQRIVQDFTGLNDPSDSSGHGTHCLATIAGRKVNGRQIGVAPGVQTLISAKIFAPGVETDAGMVLRALDWCVEQNADVISLSLGFNLVGFAIRLQDVFGMTREAAFARCLQDFQNNIRLFDAFSTKLVALEANPRNQGAIVVAASGNYSRRIPTPDKPKFVVPASPPSNALKAVAVGAVRRVDGRLNVSAFSNGTVDLVAPGSGIVSASESAPDGLQSMTGTSMACPHVAGLAALWWDAVRKGPGKKNAELVRANLINSASYDRLAPGGSAEDYGYGLPNAPQALSANR